MRHTLSTAVVTAAVFTLVGCGTSTPSSPTPSAPQPTPSTSLAADSLTISPGAIGKAKVGMTQAEAIATGYFEKSTDIGDGCGVRPLHWKGHLADTFTVRTDANGTITELGATRVGPTTSSGLGVGSTLADVSNSFESAQMYNTTSGGSGVFDSDGQRWIGFAFANPLSSVARSDQVVYIEVSDGTRPDLNPSAC